MMFFFLTFLLELIAKLMVGWLLLLWIAVRNHHLLGKTLYPRVTAAAPHWTATWCTKARWPRAALVRLPRAPTCLAEASPSWRQYGGCIIYSNLFQLSLSSFLRGVGPSLILSEFGWIHHVWTTHWKWASVIRGPIGSAPLDEALSHQHGNSLKRKEESKSSLV